jgi:hypothetical protein
MLWSVAARFGLDGFAWSVRRLEFWYRGHVEMVSEEAEAIDKAREAARGRN